MHPVETRSQFLKLRVQGWSFDRIARELRVSKPTLIAWSRRRASELEALRATNTTDLGRTLEITHEQTRDQLTTKLKALQQELVSRSLRTVPTAALEAMEAQLLREVEKLEMVKKNSLEPIPQ